VKPRSSSTTSGEKTKSDTTMVFGRGTAPL
jgi:hypothetical protein